MFDRIVLVGAGRTSGSIVERLARVAPLTIVDVSAAALDGLSAWQETPDGMHPVVRQIGDGTSRLVLEDVRGEPRTSVGLVVSPGNDRAALECCRLGAELDYKPIIAIVHDRDVAARCERHGARALVRAEIVGRLVAQALQQGGLGITSAVGSGRGEILEFSVLASSPAIGIPLGKLRADGWRVAAIYRASELVLPTGSTAVEAGDRVLIVGDPKQLPHVAESLRVGLPTFPLLHGPNVVVYLPIGLDSPIENEAEILTRRTRAASRIRVYPGASEPRRVVETPLPDGGMLRKHLEDAALEGAHLDKHVATLIEKQPGVVVARSASRTLFDVLLGRSGRDALLCNALTRAESAVLRTAEGERTIAAEALLVGAPATRTAAHRARHAETHAVRRQGLVLRLLTARRCGPRLFLPGATIATIALPWAIDGRPCESPSSPSAAAPCRSDRSSAGGDRRPRAVRHGLRESRRRRAPPTSRRRGRRPIRRGEDPAIRADRDGLLRRGEQHRHSPRRRDRRLCSARRRHRLRAPERGAELRLGSDPPRRAARAKGRLRAGGRRLGHGRGRRPASHPRGDPRRGLDHRAEQPVHHGSGHELHAANAKPPDPRRRRGRLRNGHRACRGGAGRVRRRNPRRSRSPRSGGATGAFGASSLDLALLVWIESAREDLRIASELRFAIDRAFRAHGISIPFPQRDVHLIRSAKDTVERG